MISAQKKKAGLSKQGQPQSWFAMRRSTLVKRLCVFLRGKDLTAPVHAGLQVNVMRATQFA